MDESVIAAIERWPNVPAVYGWLSLSARGQWRLHPDGQAMFGGQGESISNPQILSFINRNYGCDQQHRWFFQNGPQRVYVRLDAAPWIIEADDSAGSLRTHTNVTVNAVSEMLVDTTGRLYLQTELGCALLTDRDLPRFIERWRTNDGRTLDGQTLDVWWLDDGSTQTTVTQTPGQHWLACGQTLPVRRLTADAPVDQQLQFVANPQARSE